jgi:predicted small metal-binding protein
MPRVYIDCREMPSEANCTLALSADTEDELLEAAATHAVAVHGHTDGAELRSGLAEGIHEGAAPGAAV